MRHTLFFCLLLFTAVGLRAQNITGVVLDAISGAPVEGVAVHNIYTEAGLITDKSGQFTIGAATGQMVVIEKVGYKKGRIRIGTPVPYYRIFLEPGITELDEIEVRSHGNDFVRDSLRYHELFRKQIDFPVVTGWRAVQSPFTALSKSNKQMIHFQQEYAWFEQMKFVDYTFNEKLIANLTGLKGDSALAYMRRYRPSYEAARAMNEYQRFSYIKQTVELWRQRQRLGPDNSRGGSGGG